MTVLEISCDYFDLFSAGVASPNNGDAIGLCTVGLNWGALLETGGYHPERQWLVASTYVGHWDWAVPPNHDGLIAGIRLGVRSRHHVRDGKYLALEASYDWKWFKDVSGDEDARLETLSLGIALLNWW